MSFLARISIAFLLGTTLAPYSVARDEAPAAASQTLTAFDSDEGMTRLARSAARADFAALANQFEAQSNAAFCGPTTAAIVLNAVYGRSPDLPRDRSRLGAADLKNIPAGFDPTIARFTQDNVIARSAKTRALVLGEPVTMNGKQIPDFGYQTRQFDEMLRANGLRTRLVIADGKTSDVDIRKELIDNLTQRGDFVIVTYSRRAVGQEGGGHISPLGAYDAASDSFLILDVNPSAAGWVWMPTATLIKGMRSFDTVENRGYIIVEPR
ncbi:MAG TPA: phytochelatin synthase family protein [Rhodocyclaceae bacterium]|nr:phytochelatin synthase family protein [Rhodocyclaceae bacterium]